VRDGKKQEAERWTLARTVGGEWVASFGGSPINMTTDKVSRRFEGSALLRMRATVAYDSFERLVTVPLSPDLNKVVVADSDVSGMASELGSTGRDDAVCSGAAEGLARRGLFVN
jgi:hypothetical protein